MFCCLKGRREGNRVVQNTIRAVGLTKAMETQKERQNLVTLINPCSFCLPFVQQTPINHPFNQSSIIPFSSHNTHKHTLSTLLQDPNRPIPAAHRHSTHQQRMPRHAERRSLRPHIHLLHHFRRFHVIKHQLPRAAARHDHFPIPRKRAADFETIRLMSLVPLLSPTPPFLPFAHPSDTVSSIRTLRCIPQRSVR